MFFIFYKNLNMFIILEFVRKKYSLEEEESLIKKKESEHIRDIYKKRINSKRHLSVEISNLFTSSIKGKKVNMAVADSISNFSCSSAGQFHANLGQNARMPVTGRPCVFHYYSSIFLLRHLTLMTDLWRKN